MSSIMESNTIIYNTNNSNNTTASTPTKIKIKPTDKACKDSYKQISNYPFPCEPIRYPRLLDTNTQCKATDLNGTSVKRYTYIQSNIPSGMLDSIISDIENGFNVLCYK